MRTLFTVSEPSLRTSQETGNLTPRRSLPPVLTSPRGERPTLSVSYRLTAITETLSPVISPASRPRHSLPNIRLQQACSTRMELAFATTSKRFCNAAHEAMPLHKAMHITTQPGQPFCFLTAVCVITTLGISCVRSLTSCKKRSVTCDLTVRSYQLLSPRMPASCPCYTAAFLVTALPVKPPH